MLNKLLQPLQDFWKSEKIRSIRLPVLIILITLMLLIIFKLAKPVPPVVEQPETIWSVQTHSLVAGAKSPQLQLYGRVESPYTATLTSVIDADVKSLEVSEGQSVSQSQPLIILDDTDAKLAYDEKASYVAELEAQIQQEKNRYKIDRASLKLEKSLVALAEKKLKREEKTSKTNLTSQSSFDTQNQALKNQKLALNARQLNVTDHPTRLAQLEAKLARNSALAQKSQNDLSHATLLSPFDGIILKTMVAPGERVRPGETLIEMYATDKVELRAQVAQKFIGIIKQALADEQALIAITKIDAVNVSLTLDRVSGTIGSGTYGVDALFVVNRANADKLTIGDTLELTLELPALHDVYSVPVSSIYGTNRIYRIEDGRLAAINVEKSGSQYIDDKQFILVRNNKLQPDDKIITTQLPHAVSGLKVEVLNPMPAENKPSLSELPNNGV